MLTLSEDVQRAIAAHAAETYPYECVGLLIGHVTDDGKQALEIVRAANTWSDAVALTPNDAAHSLADRFYLDPREYLKADRAARVCDLDVIGCYHSHPDHPAIPSPRDLEGAQGVGGGSSFSFIIQSVRSGTPAELRSWLLAEDGGRFVEEAVSR